MSSTNGSSTKREQSPFSRERLKQLFQNQKQLSEADFKTLIDATLNRIDDKFHGTWKASQTYQQGDIVIYNRSLWEMQKRRSCGEQPSATKTQDPSWIPFLGGDWSTLPAEGVMWAKGDPNVGIGVGNIIGEYPKARLDVRNVYNLKLKDFKNAAELQSTKSSVVIAKILEDKAYHVYVFDKAGKKVFDQKISDAALAQELDKALNSTPLDNQTKSELIRKVSSSLGNIPFSSGRWLLFPEAGAHTQQTFLHYHSTDSDSCDIQLPKQVVSALITRLSSQEAAWLSNAQKGFTFYHHGSDLSESDVLESHEMGDDVMMVIRPYHHGDNEAVATLGLNVDTPKALLDITHNNGKQFLALPTDNDTPTLELRDFEPESEFTYYTTFAVNATETTWKTNSNGGFIFRHTSDNHGQAKDNDNTTSLSDALMHIRQHPESQRPQVGIGTDKPKAVLEVCDRTHSAPKNHIQLLPIQTNEENKSSTTLPILSIINQADEQTTTGLHSWLDGQTAGWSTNAKQGFLFKAEKAATNTDTENLVDVPLVHITPEGQLGIGKNPSENIALDVHGTVQAFTVYQTKNKEWIDKDTEEDLTEVLGKLNQLKPTTFKWSNNSGLQEEGEQIGLRIDELEKEFPQVVKISDNQISIAYQNLVPVLIQAIKEITHKEQNDYNQLQIKIEHLETKIKQLDQEQNDYDPLQKKVEQLDNRIALLAVALFVSWIILILGAWG